MTVASLISHCLKTPKLYIFHSILWKTSLLLSGFPTLVQEVSGALEVVPSFERVGSLAEIWINTVHFPKLPAPLRLEFHCNFKKTPSYTRMLITFVALLGFLWVESSSWQILHRICSACTNLAYASPNNARYLTALIYSWTARCCHQTFILACLPFPPLCWKTGPTSVLLVTMRGQELGFLAFVIAKD